MKHILLAVIMPLFIISCTQSGNYTTTLNKVWLDSIIKNSDSNYVKPYYRSDFVTAWYYINKMDSTLCQLMKDSGGIIRQIIIAKKDVRTFFAPYFANGNLQADLPLDEFGQYHGTGIFYFENGSVQSSGNFNHGLKTGSWKVYDKKGKITATDTFDKNGQLMHPAQP